MRVIGTAGHVDHGKSKLVLALTGMDPDRLQEEQEREMTIDLGFAWMTLPDGEPVGIVDVPGHRDFIENMLAGVGSIDMALFVVAADEGVMPQTREHMAILDLLDIPEVVIALTKVDLVHDPDWIPLVKEEVQELVRNTHFEEAEILPVSSKTGDGLEDLRETIGRVLQSSQPRRDLGRPRLGVDRVFSIAGFGTIVTGTLIDGALEVGQSIEVLPPGLSGRIRGLQTHKQKIDHAVPGSRVAANLTGIEVKDLQRGDVVIHPGTYTPTKVIDVQFRVLAGPMIPIKHNQNVKLFLGAAQRQARIRLLGVDELGPGEEGWLQLVLREPLVATRGDRLILRRPSPSATLGGGRVADPHPPRRHRRNDMNVLSRLEKMVSGSPADVLAVALKELGPTTLDRALERAGMEREAALAAIESLKERDLLVMLPEGDLALGSESAILHRETFKQIKDTLLSVLMNYHQDFPLRLGMPREELKSRLKLSGKIFSEVLRAASRQGWVVEAGPLVKHPDHSVVLDREQQTRVDRLMQAFQEDRFSPPSVKEAVEVVGDDLLSYLLDSEQLIQLSEDVLLDRDAYVEMKEGVRELLEQNDRITVAQVRDHFQTSRKYALALMEHLDQIGFTVREGDERRLARTG